jgi:HK97 family phage prohead protease
MTVRSKNGIQEIDGNGLLDFLTGRRAMKDGEGTRGNVIRIDRDIELICPVPFRLGWEAGSNGAAWTFSTFDLDRFGERIDPAGWEYARYLKNPVIEWAHRYDIPAIGKADSLCADEKGLHGMVIFNDRDYDPFGWAIGERVRRGVIRAGSVGFRILEVEIPDKETAKDGTTLIFRRQELLEFSICNVPANPFALAKGNEQLKMSNEQCGNIRQFWAGLLRNE